MITRNVLGEEVKALDTKHAELFTQDTTQETQYRLYQDTIYKDYVFTQEEIQRLKEEAESNTNLSGAQEATLALINALNNTKPYEAEIKKGLELYEERRGNTNGSWSECTETAFAGVRLFNEIIDYLGTLNIANDRLKYPIATIPNHAIFFVYPPFQGLINYPNNAYYNTTETQGFKKAVIIKIPYTYTDVIQIISKTPQLMAMQNDCLIVSFTPNDIQYAYCIKAGRVINVPFYSCPEITIYDNLTELRKLIDWLECYIVWGYLHDWGYTGHYKNFTKPQRDRYSKLESAYIKDRNWAYYKRHTQYLDLTKTFYTLEYNWIGDVTNVKINKDAINSFISKLNEFRARIDLLPQSTLELSSITPPYINLKDILEKELKIPSATPIAGADRNKIIFGFSEESCADLLYFQDFLQKNGLLDKIPALKVWTPKSANNMGNFDCVLISSSPYYLYAYVPQNLMMLDNVFFQYVIENYFGAISNDGDEVEAPKFNTYEALKEYLQKLPYLYKKRIELLKSKKQELLNSIQVYYNVTYAVATHEQKAELKAHYDKFLETISLEDSLVSDVLDKNKKMLEKLEKHIENGDGIIDNGEGDIDIDFDNKLPTINKQFWQVNKVSLIVGTPKKVYTKDKDRYTPIENSNIGYSKIDKLYCIEYTLTAKSEGVFNFEIQLGDQKQALEIYAFSQDTIEATLAHYSKKMFYYAKFGIGDELQGTMVYKNTAEENSKLWGETSQSIAMKTAFVSSYGSLPSEYGGLEFVKELSSSGNQPSHNGSYQYIGLSDDYKNISIDVTSTNGIFLTKGLLLKSEYDGAYHKDFLKNNFLYIFNFMKNYPIQAFMCYKLKPSFSDSFIGSTHATLLYAVVYKPKEAMVNQINRLRARVKVFKHQVDLASNNFANYDKKAKAEIDEFNSLGDLDNFVTQHPKEYANVHMEYSESQRPTSIKIFPYHINTTRFVSDIISDPNTYKHTTTSNGDFYIRFFVYENQTPKPIRFSDTNNNSELSSHDRTQLNFKHSFSRGVRKAYIAIEFICTKPIEYNYPENFTAANNETRYTFENVSIFSNQAYGQTIYKNTIFINDASIAFNERLSSIEKQAYGNLRIYEINTLSTGTFKQVFNPIRYANNRDWRLLVLHLTFS